MWSARQVLRRRGMGRLGMALIGAAAALSSLAGCTDDGGSVLIDLKTDYAAGIEFHSVRVVLEDPRTGRPMTEMRAVTRSQDFIHGVRAIRRGRPARRRRSTAEDRE